MNVKQFTAPCPIIVGMCRRHVVAAGVAGAALSGVPSTVLTLVRGEDLLDGARAAGAIVAPRAGARVQLAAAVPVHLALSFGWAAVLAAMLPPRREPPTARSAAWRSPRSTSA